MTGFTSVRQLFPGKFFSTETGQLTYLNARSIFESSQVIPEPAGYQEKCKKSNRSQAFITFRLNYVRKIHPGK